MDKELKELENTMKEFMEFLKTINKDTKCETESTFGEASKQEASLYVKKDKSGKVNIKAEGSSLGLLILLAGLEKGLLKQLDCPDCTWELIKNKVGAREADINE